MDNITRLILFIVITQIITLHVICNNSRDEEINQIETWLKQNARGAISIKNSTNIDFSLIRNLSNDDKFNLILSLFGDRHISVPNLRNLRLKIYVGMTMEQKRYLYKYLVLLINDDKLISELNQRFKLNFLQDIEGRYALHRFMEI